MVEGTGLLNLRRGNSTVGSNPTLSAFLLATDSIPALRDGIGILGGFLIPNAVECSNDLLCCGPNQCAIYQQSLTLRRH